MMNAIKTKKDAINFVNTTLYERDLQLRYKLLYLLVARDNGDEKMVDFVIGDLTLESQSINQVSSIVVRNFGAYGVDELRFIYDTVTYHDCVVAMLKAERQIWREISWDYVLGSFDGSYTYTCAILTNRYLSPRLKNAYQTWFYELAKPYYRNLKLNDMTRYIKIRKATNYKVMLQTHTNQDIVDACEKGGLKLNWYQVDKVRKAFGYEAEPQDSLPLRQQRDWKRNHPNELYYLIHTNADLIEESEVRSTLSQIKSELKYSDADITVLRNWLNRARYEGNGSDFGIKVTDSLRKRYMGLGKGDTDDCIFKRMRVEIRTAMNDGRINKNLCSNVISRIDRCRGDYELRTA